MKLRVKITLVILFIIGIYAVLDFAIQRLIILPSFLELERETARQNLLRSREAIQNELEHLKLFTADWSMWDDTYRFVQDKNQEYIDGNLQANTFQMSKLNLLFFYNETGNLVWGKYFDLKDAEFQEYDIFPEKTQPGDKLVGHQKTMDSVTGIMTTRQGPLLFASMPVVTSAQEGPIKGTLISGRLLTKELEDKLVRQTHVSFNLVPVGQDKTEEITQLLANVPEGGDPLLIKASAHELTGYDLMRDYLSQPAFLIKAVTTREISSKGEQTLIMAVSSVVLAGTMVALVLLGVMKHMVVQPLSKVAQHAQAVGGGPDYSLRLNSPRQDEIGLLANEIDAMVERLAYYQKRLADQSYQAGMSEQAAATLHNLRNAMVSLTVPLETIHERFSRLPQQELSMALEELSGSSVDPARREALEHFTRLGLRAWLEMAEDYQGTYAKVRERIRLIEGILSWQETLSPSPLPLEYFFLDELLEDAMRLEANLFSQSQVQVVMDGELRQIGHLHLPRVILLQVVSNLFINAVEAIASGNNQPGTIHVKAQKMGQQVELSFQDNGCGIEEQDLTRIFQRHFSTKTVWGRGVGLHWCANVVNAMGGQLTAESPGPGKGATFRLLVPLAMEDSSHVPT
ncbi:MAG: HAMP domain-containing protein [Magnetococcales bacterium]|nr:HAMP domain-containing protein [Magnetococcales bacterium]NGZ27614.1 HAMP domain-containing protein [Magnetococcales bacterium]